ncbi:ribosomal protein S6 kinase-related protein [Lissotriton helveticus]
MSRYIYAISSSCFHMLRLLQKMFKWISTESRRTVTHALIISRTDYSNALFAGITLKKLQNIQNASAGLILNIPHCGHITYHEGILLTERIRDQSWKSVLYGVGLATSSLECLLAARRSMKEKLWMAQKSVEEDSTSSAEDSPPHFFSLFLPEFPIWQSAGQQQLKILGFVAKGSLGPVLKVLDCTKASVFAVKVLPKMEVIRRDTLKQCKEEVSIQRQINHPFIRSIGDSWQGKQHLFIMCSYCSSGDLYRLWMSTGCFGEETVRLFAAELVSVLGYLHDLGIVHRDVKMENILLDERGHIKVTDFGLSRQLHYGERAYTICGTLQYMAPEVLQGGPYNHSVDWWSMGVLLYALAVGKFPVAPEKDHVAMLESVNQTAYDMPANLSSSLALLLKELLCRNPHQRLHHRHQFENHLFFRGLTFDPVELQKYPVDFVVNVRKSEPMAMQELDGFCDFDGDFSEVLEPPSPD